MSESDRTVVDAILAGRTPPAVPTRREFPRFSATYPILLELESGDRPAVSGTTINLCRTGMLATLDEPVKTGTRCEIGFIPTQRYKPELIDCPHCGSQFPVLELPLEPILGTVVRAERPEAGFVVAILFDEPLEAMH